MRMPVDAKRITEEAKASKDRVKFSVTIPRKLLNAFKSDCKKKKADYSATVEFLLKDFLGLMPPEEK